MTILFIILVVVSFGAISCFNRLQFSKSPSISHFSLNKKSIIKQKFELNSQTNKDIEDKKPSAFDQVASTGLAGVLAIATAEGLIDYKIKY
jgi:hypothetical protein